MRQVRLCRVVVLLRPGHDADARGPSDRAAISLCAVSKYQGEQAAFHWHQVYRLPVNSIRIFNAYGTRSRTSGAYGAVFGVFLRQKLAGKPFTVVGDGTQTPRLPLCHRRRRGLSCGGGDASASGEIWNLGAGNPQSVNRLVELLGGDVVHIPKRPGEPDCTLADICKIKRELGWEPQVSFEEGVAQMVAEDRVLARRAAVGSRIDRQGDEDLVQPTLEECLMELTDHD